MKTQALIPIILSLALTASGCASLAPPERPIYQGADNINSAKTSQLVGVWSVTDLNPYPDTAPQATTIEYRADGSIGGLIEMNKENLDGMEHFGDMQFEVQGQWVLEADTVTHQNVKMNSPTEGTMSAMIASIINQQNGISGQANIYELSADRIVMVSEDGNAMEYIRQ
jgi:hypothetical protein